MQSTDGDDIRVGDTVWFTQDGHGGGPAPESAEPNDPSSTLDSGRVVELNEHDDGLEVDTGVGRELIGLYTIQFVQPESEP